MAMAAGFERIFEIGPVFRAFPFITARHDTEFTSVDVEMSWIDSHHDLMAFEEGWLRHVIAAVAAEHGDDIVRLFGTEVVVPSLPFPRVSLDAARTWPSHRATSIRAASGRWGSTWPPPSGTSSSSSPSTRSRRGAFTTCTPTTAPPTFGTSTCCGRGWR
jgi:aspartyl-tRNA synthetase